MNKKMLGIFSLVLIAAVSMQSAGAVTQVTVTGAGSTFAQVILNVWGNDYSTQTNDNFQMSYGGGGSGQGIASITNLSVNFAGSDAPLSTTQTSTANTNANKDGHHLGQINTIPESAGGIVLAYNLKTGINGPLNLTADLIAQIMQRNITNWGDAALKANNLNPGLSSTADIKVVHRSDGSGTTFAFTNYLSVSSTMWKLGQGTTVSWDAATIGAKGNPGVASTITSTDNAIGYVELAYALQNTISTAFIMNKDNHLVNATLGGITAAVNTATNNLPSATGDWSSVSINNQAGTTTYPICTFTYLFIYNNMTEYGDTGAALIAFLQYIMTSSAQAKATDIGYVPLPSSLLTKNLGYINAFTYMGDVSAYGGTNTAGRVSGSSSSSSASSNSSSSNTTSPGFELFAVTGLFVVASSIAIFKRKNKLN